MLLGVDLLERLRTILIERWYRPLKNGLKCSNRWVNEFLFGLRVVPRDDTDSIELV